MKLDLETLIVINLGNKVVINLGNKMCPHFMTERPL
jgi:hypothetical protein